MKYEDMKFKHDVILLIIILIKKEILSFATTKIEYEGIMLNEMSRQK